MSQPIVSAEEIRLQCCNLQHTMRGAACMCGLHNGAFTLTVIVISSTILTHLPLTRQASVAALTSHCAASVEGLRDGLCAWRRAPQRPRGRQQPPVRQQLPGSRRRAAVQLLLLLLDLRQAGFYVEGVAASPAGPLSRQQHNRSSDLTKPHAEWCTENRSKGSRP